MSITDRVERIRLNYVNSKPAISYERARIWTESIMDYFRMLFHVDLIKFT